MENSESLVFKRGHGGVTIDDLLSSGVSVTRFFLIFNNLHLQYHGTEHDVSTRLSYPTSLQQLLLYSNHLRLLPPRLFPVKHRIRSCKAKHGLAPISHWFLECLNLILSGLSTASVSCKHTWKFQIKLRSFFRTKWKSNKPSAE